MKVLHINTFEYGGAANAAIRLHNAMLAAGVDSTILTCTNLRGDIAKHISYENLIKPKSIFQKLVYVRPDVFVKRIKDSFAWRVIDQIKLVAYNKIEYITFNKTSCEIHKIKNFDSYDIIHLHWVSDFLDWSTFFEKVSHKKIVWSLHDMAPFTGGYHYADGYVGYLNNDADAPFLKDTQYAAIFNKQLEEKKQIFKNLNLDLHIVGLSSWMNALALDSALFKNYKKYFIPNTLDSKIFAIQNKKQCRLHLGLPSDKKIVIFVSDNINNKRKGLDLFKQAYELLKSNEDIFFVSIGKKSVLADDSTMLHLGELTHESEMATLYNAADVVVVPSREDNLPNTALEALFCGVPVVGFNIGGMPDLVFSTEMGRLSPRFDNLAETILETLNANLMPQRIRFLAMSRFLNDVVVNQYLDIYTSSEN